MKRIPSLPLFALLAVAAATLRAAEPVPAAGPSGDGDRPVHVGVEFRAGGVMLHDHVWDDSAAGFVDAGLTLWDRFETIGVWAGVGGMSAELDWRDDWGPVKSDILAVPAGASLLLRLPLAPALSLRGEAGLRYLALDVDDWDDDWDRRYRRRRTTERDRYHHPDSYLDVDDTSLAIVALKLEFWFGPGFFGIGGGYQFDLEKPDIEYCGSPIAEADFSGAFFFVDVGFAF